MSMVLSPYNWKILKFTEILDVQGGTQPPKSQFISEPKNGYVRLLQIRDFGNKPVPTYIPDTTKLKKCEENDLLIGRYGASLGRICSGMNGAYNVALAKVLIPKLVVRKFVKYYLLSDMFQHPLKLLSRSAQNGFNKDDLAKFDFLLPPLEEQKVIAAKLDDLFSQVDIMKARLDSIPVILKRLRQSVLAAAVSGKLTEEWRESNPQFEKGEALLDRWLKQRRENFGKNQADLVNAGKQKKVKKFREPTSPDLETISVNFPLGWGVVSVSQFADCLDHMRIPVKKENRTSVNGLYPYFGANGEVDRVDEYLFDDDLVLVTEDETFYGREKPIAYRYTGKCWVNNHAHVLRAPTKDANDFLCYSLMYYDVIPWLSGTTGRAKLTQAALNTLPIGLPSEKEQEEIVRRVKEFINFSDKIEQQVKFAQSRINLLARSILIKTFRGDITVDWREKNPDLITGENSAGALLEKIKQEIETVQTKKKNKKKSKKKAAKKKTAA